MTLRCAAHRGVKFFELCERISQRNRNRIRKYFSLFTRAQMSSNHEKTGGRKSRDTQTSVTDLFKVSLNLDMNNPKNRKINYNKLNRKAVFRIRIQGLKKI